MTLKSIIIALFFLVICTSVESYGDATIRKALAEHNLQAKVLMFFLGAGLLFAYGLFLNLAPIAFEKVVGLYIATLFIVWQVVSYISFGTTPGLITWISGALIVSGGCLLTFWR